MSYLIRNGFGLKEVEKYEEVINILRKYTASWCADKDYHGEDFETLFQNCLENKDFGDIAQVYEIDTYFEVFGGKKIPCGLYVADKNTDFKLRRIF